MLWRWMSAFALMAGASLLAPGGADARPGEPLQLDSTVGTLETDSKAVRRVALMVGINIALFYFSGHGQQIPDAEDGDEHDGYDEAIVPYDNTGHRRYSGHLPDDALEAAVTEVRAKTKNVVVIFDSCHSGTGLRGGPTPRGKEPTSPPAKRKGRHVDGASSSSPTRSTPVSSG
jgi:uncharacterized caspase-like protein